MTTQHTPHLSDELTRQLQPLIVRHEYLEAMTEILQTTNYHLHKALTAVEALRIATHRQIPEQVEQRVHVLLAANQRNAAIHYLTQHTDMDERDRDTYVDAVLPSIRIRISEQDAQELLTLHRQGKTGEAAKRVRAKNSVGLAEAISFLDLLQGATTQVDELLQVEGTTTVSPVTSHSSHLPARVKTRIEHDFSEEERDAAKLILTRYGENLHERVQLAVVQLAEGDAVEFLEWLQEAQQDYRDVLWAASEM